MLLRINLCPQKPQVGAIVERIHQVLGNLLRTYKLQETYADEADPWMGILAASAFALRSTYHSINLKVQAS